jgi:hypothetical protein
MEGVVDAVEVDDIEGEWLLAKVVRLAKGDVELDTPSGMGSFPRMIP